jgi:hypothetical protein
MTRLGLAVLAALALAGPAHADVERPWLGISFRPRGVVGVLVTNVFEESGAMASGLRPGDEIIEVGDAPTPTGTQDLWPYISPHAIGDRVPLRVYRDGQVLTLHPVLSRRLSENELLHSQLVGRRAPAFNLVRSPDPQVPTIDASILAGKVGVVVWFSLSCLECTAVANEIASWADRQPADKVVALAGTGSLNMNPDALLLAFQTVMASAPVLLPVGLDQDAWLSYGIVDGAASDRMVSVAVVDQRGFVRMAAALEASDPALDDVYAAAEGLIKRRFRR